MSTWIIIAAAAACVAAILGVYRLARATTAARASALTTWAPAGRARGLLVTAHPDDEAMFFVPAMTCSTSPREWAILCLCTGNADGLGSTRSQELINAAAVLGIPASRVHIIDDAALPDGMHVQWAPQDVAQRIAHVVSIWDPEVVRAAHAWAWTALA